MTGPSGSPGGAGVSDRAALVLIGVLATVLVSGFVVLSALGRDTTSYLLFLGGPAVSAIVGAVLSRRVSHVQEQVSTTAGETQAVVVDNVAELANHLQEQDVVIGQAARDAQVARLAVARTTDTLPAARSGESDRAPSAAAQSSRVRNG